MMGRILQGQRRGIRKSFILVLVCCLALPCPRGRSQNLIDPVSGTTTQYTQINSDYGPRHSYGSNPHIGIDYQLSQGGKAHCVQGGTVKKIFLASTDDAYIQIGNWRYVHLKHGENGDGTWGLYPFGNYGIIFLRRPVNNQLVTLRAISDSIGVLNATDPVTHQIVTPVNQVNSGDIVFCSNQLNHLHIDYSPPNLVGWENPLRYIAHKDQYAPGLSLLIQHQNGSNATDFQGSVIYGYPLILCTRQDATQDKDFNRLAISVKPEYSPATLERVYDYEHYGLGGTPIFMLSSVNDILSSLQEGIFPEPGFVSRDYFKHHFYSRVTDAGQESYCDLDCKYPDGRYSFLLEGSDITNHTTTLDRDIILDNFKPFIRSVSITSGQLLYAAYAHYDKVSQSLQWSVQSSSAFASGLMDVQVHVETSEPMASMSFDLADANILAQLNDHSFFPASTDGRQWAASIPFIHLYHAIQGGNVGFQSLIIEGSDLAGNELFVPACPGNTPGTAFPHRMNNGSWQPANKTSVDDNHGFYLGSSPDPNLIVADFLANTVSGSSPMTVHFADISAGKLIGWQWNFGNGVIWNGQSPPAVTYTNFSSEPVYYSVRLIITDEGGEHDTLYRVNYIKVSPAGQGSSLYASYSFDQVSLGVPSVVHFINHSSGDGLSYSWDFDDGTSSSACSPTHVFTSPGYYDVTLTVTDAFGDTDQDEKTVYVYPGIISPVNVAFDVEEPVTAGDFTRFHDQTTGGPSFSKRMWDFGDGQLQEVLGVPMHLYYSPGIYQVRLEVRDYLDNLLGCCIRNITVIPNALNDLSTELNQIKAPDTWWDDMMGRAVAIEDQWAFAGAPYDDDKGSASGSVYVFRLGIDSSWTFFQKLVHSKGKADDYFGHSLSCNGNWLLAGAPGNANSSHGKAVLYLFDGHSWQEYQTLNGPATYYQYGWSVSIDGMKCCIAAPNNSQQSPGAVFVYRYIGSKWFPEATLTNTLASLPDWMGFDVSLDGDHLATCLHPPFGQDQVWFWSYDGAQWHIAAKKNVASAVSVAMDCGRAVVGDPFNNRVCMFRMQNGTWSFDGYILPADGSGSGHEFGKDVDLCGAYLMVGKPGDDVQQPASGSAYIYREDQYGYWKQYAKLSPWAPDMFEHFGYRVALSPNHAISGAYGWKGNRGSAYTYTNLTEPCDRLIDWCWLELFPGEEVRSESGDLGIAGTGCLVSLEQASRLECLSRGITIREGFTAWVGSEATLGCIDCSLASPGSSKQCDCPVGDVQDDSTGYLSPTRPMLNAFPNPSAGPLTLRWDQPYACDYLYIRDLSGRLLQAHDHILNGTSIDLSSLNPGIYLLEIRIAGQVHNLRWIRI